MKYTPKATQKSPTTLQHHSITEQPTTTLSQTYSTKSQSSTIRSQTQTTQSQLLTTQHLPILTKSSTTKSLSSTSKPNPRITQHIPGKPQEPRILQTSSTIENIHQSVPSVSTAIHLEISIPNEPLIQSSTTSDRQQESKSLHTTTSDTLNTASSHTASKRLPYTVQNTPRLTKSSTSSTQTNTHVDNPTPCSTCHFQPNAPKFFSKTSPNQSLNTQIPVEMKPKSTHEPYSPTIDILPILHQPHEKWEPSSQSNTIQNAPQTDKTLVNEKPPGTEQGKFSYYLLLLIMYRLELFEIKVAGITMLIRNNRFVLSDLSKLYLLNRFCLGYLKNKCLKPENSLGQVTSL